MGVKRSAERGGVEEKKEEEHDSDGICGFVVGGNTRAGAWCHLELPHISEADASAGCEGCECTRGHSVVGRGIAEEQHTCTVQGGGGG